MLFNRHLITIYVNGEEMELYDQTSLNLRITSNLYNPTEVISKQSEYSYSFNLPITNKNNKIFGYSNSLSKLNKFNKKYNAIVYGDGVEIFSGILRISSINSQSYKCNVISPKLFTVEDIFSESKLNELDWYVPFEGVPTIVSINNSSTSDYFFPLVSYGVFQKSPQVQNQTYNLYSGVYEIDKTNRFYLEDFPPSLKLIEIVKRCFAHKGYDVKGDVFDDDVVKNLYMSTNLSQDQQPLYNLANKDIGRIDIRCHFDNNTNLKTGASNHTTGLLHNLAYPYQFVGSRGGGEANFNSVEIYDLLSHPNSLIDIIDGKYLFDQDENCVIIPADGLYKIQVYGTVALPVGGTGESSLNMTVDEGYITRQSVANGDGVLTRQATFEKNITERCPVEIQLLKNGNTTELIKGSVNIDYTNGSSTGDNVFRNEYYTAYPHEDLKSASNPTVSTARYTSTNTSSSSRRASSIESSRSGARTRPDRDRVPTVNTDNTDRGYMTRAGELFMYDPFVNDNFICGYTPWGGGCPAVIKNGYSWNKQYADKINTRYDKETGYWHVTGGGRGGSSEYTWTPSDFNKNQLVGSPFEFLHRVETTNYTSDVAAIVELKKNDVLSLKAVTRYYENNGNRVGYSINGTAFLIVEAYSPKPIATVDDKTWYTPSDFDTDLRLSNFLNNEILMSEFVTNFINSFNLSYEQIGNTVYLNKQQFNINSPKIAINIDNRVINSDAESSPINYPSYLQVKYNIDKEEEGFYQSVPDEFIDLETWQDHGEEGSSPIPIVPDDEAEKEEIQLNNSYTWYNTFVYKPTDTSEAVRLTIPVISKWEWMVDGADYEESMRHDGFSQPYRFWFRNPATPTIINLTNGESVYVTLPTNNNGTYDLNYYNVDNSLLKRFFNITPLVASNYVTVKCYLTPDEYKSLKNGANIVFDSDVYIVNSLSGYDPSGNNTTTIQMMKKV